MRKGKSNIKILFIILVALSAISTVAIVLFILSLQVTSSLKAQVKDLETSIEMNTQYVYVAMDDLPRGTILEADVNVMLQENLTGLPTELYLQEDALGSILLVDVDAYAPIMANMATREEVEDDTREYEVSSAILMTNQHVNDYVDIRIMFPTGEDYIVVSKARIKNLILENSIFYTNLSEAEILTLASAMVDAYTIPGTQIYVTRYLAESLQEEAVPNYPVRGETIALMSTDPNVLEVARQTLNLSARQAMEQKLAALTQEYLDMVVDGQNEAESRNTATIKDRSVEEYGGAY